MAHCGWVGAEGEWAGMARKKAKVEEPEDHWAYYRSIQLTPEQKAEMRAEMERAAQKAREDGVYERVLSLIGNLHLDQDDLDEVRRDRS